MAVLFDLTLSGSGSAGTSAWINLGAIPTGYKVWMGKSTYTAVSKAFAFELRSNLAGQSAGTTGATTLLDSAAPKSGASISHDLYKNGTLNVKTVVGSGTEHWWLRLTSKSGTSGTYQYTLSYTTA